MWQVTVTFRSGSIKYFHIVVSSQQCHLHCLFQISFVCCQSVVRETIMSCREGARLVMRMRSNSAAAVSRTRCNSVIISSYPRLSCHTCDYETRSRDNLINHQETMHRKPLVKLKPRLSTFSFRSRASSVSSFSSSASSGSSSSSSHPSPLHSQYNTEMFWNRYKRYPDTDNIVTNIIRRSRLRRFISKDKRYQSSFDLYMGDIMWLYQDIIILFQW